MESTAEIGREMSTEERIKEAATKVFTKKGFYATKTRDIAEEAKINIASLHYYFKSKEKLFEIIMCETMKRYSISMDQVFSTDDSLPSKIKHFVHSHIDFMKVNPYVPMFLMSESQTNPEKVQELLNDDGMMEQLEKQLVDLADKGIIRKVNCFQFVMNLVSLTVFPFISKSLMCQKSNITPEEYDRLLEERKDIIPDLLINYLYLKKEENG